AGAGRARGRRHGRGRRAGIPRHRHRPGRARGRHLGSRRLAACGAGNPRRVGAARAAPARPHHDADCHPASPLPAHGIGARLSFPPGRVAGRAEGHGRTFPDCYLTCVLGGRKLDNGSGRLVRGRGRPGVGWYVLWARRRDDGGLAMARGRRLITLAASGAIMAGLAVAAPAATGAGAAGAAATAPGAPGAPSYFDLARKDCVGTAAAQGSKVWYTVADGVLSDVYEPTIDNTNVSTLQYVVTDGSTL